MNNTKNSQQLYIVPDFICKKDQEIIVIDAKLSDNWGYIRDCFYQMRSYISSLDKCQTGYLICNGVGPNRCGEYIAQKTDLIHSNVHASDGCIVVVDYDLTDKNKLTEVLNGNPNSE